MVAQHKSNLEYRSRHSSIDISSLPIKLWAMAVPVVELTSELTAPFLPLVGVRPCPTSRLFERLVAPMEFFDRLVEQRPFRLPSLFSSFAVLDMRVDTIEDGTFILFGAWHKFREALYAVVDDLTSSSFN
jgi:hypothetical protein